jgi:hypothetical protein
VTTVGWWTWGMMFVCWVALMAVSWSFHLLNRRLLRTNAMLIKQLHRFEQARTGWDRADQKTIVRKEGSE